jgi:hypothetical protein
MGLATAIAFFLWLNRNEALTMLIVTILPTGVAAVLGASTVTPFAEVEQTTSRPLPGVRLLHLGSLMLYAVLALFAAGFLSPSPDLPLILARNGLGYTGLALLSTRFSGASKSWIAPLLYGGSAFLSGSERAWAWPTHPAGDEVALVIAVALALVGLGATMGGGSPLRFFALLTGEESAPPF